MKKLLIIGLVSLLSYSVAQAVPLFYICPHPENILNKRKGYQFTENGLRWVVQFVNKPKISGRNVSFIHAFYSGPEDPPTLQMRCDYKWPVGKNEGYASTMLVANSKNIVPSADFNVPPLPYNCFSTSPEHCRFSFADN